MNGNELKEDLLSGAKAAADYTGVNVRTIYALVEKGLVPVIRKGKMLFFRKSELDTAFSSEAAA